MTPCPTPLPWETLVAYWAHDLPPVEEETGELHLMGCAPCSVESARVAAVAEGMRDQRERRRRRRLGAAGSGFLAATAAAVLMLALPRGATVLSVDLPAPVRDAAVVELSPPASARDVRLVPGLAGGVTANGARVRRLGGGWLSVRVEAGPPLAVVLARADLPPGRYELELVAVAAGGREESRGFYRFSVTK